MRQKLDHRQMKVRELLRDLRERGCRPVRCRGSHQTWLTPAGEFVTLVVNHLGGDVSPVVLASVRRALRG